MRGKKLEQVIKSYVDASIIEGNSKDSLENKKGGFKRLLEYLDGREFNPDEIKSYTLFLMERGLMPSSIATDLRKYKALVNWMFKQDIITTNWANKIILPKIPNKEIDVPNAELAEKIIIAGTTPDKHNVHKVINNEGRDCMLLMIRTGLRVNEALHLKKEDLFFENIGHEWFRVASKGKGGEKDKLPLMASAVEILKRERYKISRVGCHKEQFFNVSEHALNAMLKRGCNKLGVDKITSHKLRHVFGTDMARNGIPSYHLQKLMRHSELETTLRYYVHLNLEDYRKSLDMYHPLALKDRSPQQVLDQLRESIRQLKIENDKRFKITSGGSYITVENV